MRLTLHLAFLWALALLLPAYATAQGNSSPSGAAYASLPHDSHAGITISAEPITDSSRAKHLFRKADPLPAGILPVEVFVRNDTNEPVQIGLDTIQLEIHYQSGRMDGVDSLTPAQAARAIAHPNDNPAAPRERRFPIGMAPIGDKKADKLLETLRPLALNSDVVPPMGTIQGYLFFDLQRDLSLVKQSSLYIPDAVIIPSKKPLIFFEVSFAKP
ncbi:MAG: hypothetical protein ACRD4R_03930 [Candidatus Acidiferrales bacterium]